MIVLCDSSPLITLSKIGRLELLHELYGKITITPEVYSEVVLRSTHLAGAAELPKSAWIQVYSLKKQKDLDAMRQRFGIGAGEASVIQLGQEIGADILLMDDRKARNSARGLGLAVLGCVGILQDGFRSKRAPDLSQAYRELAVSGAYVDRALLENILKILKLPPLSG